MNKNEEKDLEIIVRWEEEKEIKTVKELKNFINEKYFDVIKDNKLFISYEGYEIEYDLISQKYFCKELGMPEIDDLYTIISKIDEKLNNKSKIIQSMDMDRNL
jgi:hypothetical protein